MNNNGKREYSLIFLVQFLFVAFIVFHNTCNLNISNNISPIITSIFFMCVGYSNYLSIEASSNYTKSILIRGALYYIVSIAFGANITFIFAITYMIICGFCLFADIRVLLAIMAFTFGMAGLLTNSIYIFGFLFLYIGMIVAKHRKKLHYIPMGNFIIPIFTVVLLDNLFRYHIVYSPDAILSISTIGISFVILLLITCVPVYSQGRKIDVINISSALSFFLYKYETKLLEDFISPILLSLLIIFINTLISWCVYVVIRRFLEKYYIKNMHIMSTKVQK